MELVCGRSERRADKAGADGKEIINSRTSGTFGEGTSVLAWVLSPRFFDSRTVDELEAYVRENRVPDPAPNRPSRLDGLDRKSLLQLWEEDEQILEYRSNEDLKHFCSHGPWPERLSRLKYSHKNGTVTVEFEKVAESELTSD